jgi:hypothetical protein
MQIFLVFFGGRGGLDKTSPTFDRVGLTPPRYRLKNTYGQNTLMQN